MRLALHSLLVKPLVAAQIAWLYCWHRAVYLSHDRKHEKQCHVVTYLHTFGTCAVFITFHDMGITVLDDLLSMVRHKARTTNPTPTNL